MKCDCINGSILNGIQHPILFSFVLHKTPGYKVIYEPQTILYKKMNKSAVNTITFYLEDDNHEYVNSKGETLTFSLQLIKS